ncbi:hypothetical protein [Herbidospora mongoliensis]|uniref:hypothetical protein n=1 Tax=Herbidospora mongoliensis TaxID=688067 RepID=UPI000AEFFC4A|nr:hypothetical protein [Herbidospora mongoliensis]
MLNITVLIATPWLTAARPATDAASYGPQAKLRVDGTDGAYGAFAPNQLVRRMRTEQTVHTASNGGVGRPRPAWSRPVIT